MTTTPAIEPLLATKLLVPPSARDRLARPRLAKRLSTATKGPVTIVSAPSGFGKTTALADWAAEAGMPVAWLSLDGGESRADRFLAHLTAALRTLWPGIGRRVLTRLETVRLTGAGELLAALFAEAAEAATAAGCSCFALVLDDFETIHDARDGEEDIRDALAFAVQRQPAALRLILSTTGEPAVPFAAAESITAADLRFTTAEAGLFFKGTLELDLPRERIEALASRTGGRIAALHLAGLARRGRQRSAETLRSWPGDPTALFDSLLDEVLKQQPEDVRRFLLETSVMERLSGPLSDAVADRRDGRLMLERIERAGLFLVPLDPRRFWYHYPAVFADALRRRLRLEGPEAEATPHRLASVWFEENGMPHGAIRHALAAGDTARAAGLVETEGRRLLADGSIRTVSGWLADLPAEVIDRRPELGLLLAWAHVMSRDLAPVEPRLEETERALARLPAGQEPRRTRWCDRVRGEIAVMRAILALFAEDSRAAIARAQEALALAADQRRSLWGSAELVLAMAYRQRGDLARAQELALHSFERSHTARNSRQSMIALTLLARVQRLQGRLREGLETGRRSLRIAAEAGWSDLPGVSWVRLGIAEALYERGELAEAEEELSEALERSRQEGMAEAEGMAKAWLALVRHARGRNGDSGHAGSALADIADIAGRSVPVFERIPLYRARLWLARGEVGAVERWLEENGLGLTAGPLDPEREPESLLLARVLLARGRSAEAVDLLAARLRAAEAGGHGAAALEALALLSLAHWQQESERPALDSLRRALHLAALEGFVQTFVDLGQPMADLLEHARNHGVHPELCARLLAYFPADPR